MELNFTEFINKRAEEKPCGIFNPPITDREAVYYLQQYLLGEDWYDVNPVSQEQVNVEIVHQILYKHSSKYRKERRDFLNGGKTNVNRIFRRRRKHSR